MLFITTGKILLRYLALIIYNLQLSSRNFSRTQGSTWGRRLLQGSRTQALVPHHFLLHVPRVRFSSRQRCFTVSIGRSVDVGSDCEDRIRGFYFLCFVILLSFVERFFPISCHESFSRLDFPQSSVVLPKFLSSQIQ